MATSYLYHESDRFFYKETSEVADFTPTFLVIYPSVSISYPDHQNLLTDLMVDIDARYLNDSICKREVIEKELGRATLPGNIEGNKIPGARLNWPYLQSLLNSLLYPDDQAVLSVQYFPSDPSYPQTGCSKPDCFELYLRTDINQKVQIDCPGYRVTKETGKDSVVVTYRFNHK